MNLPGLDVASALAPLIERGDFWRGPHHADSLATFKEWSHFVVLCPELTLLVNYNVSRSPAVRWSQRVVVLARTADGRWEGDVDTYDPADVRMPGGGIDADFGGCRLRFRRGAYELVFALRTRPIAGQLRLRPCSRPALTSSAPLGGGRHMHWFVVPVLEADGEVDIGARRVSLRNAPAYHDHDWGDFLWGEDFSWEWAIALPQTIRGGWALLFQRISNRARGRARSRGVLLWRDGEHVRTLHESQVRVHTTGAYRAHHGLRVPRVMSLVSPARAADIPERIEVSIESGADHAAGAFEIADLAQVAVPNDADLGTTVISECHAHARLIGTIAGSPVEIDAPAIVELNRGAA